MDDSGLFAQKRLLQRRFFEQVRISYCARCTALTVSGVYVGDPHIYDTAKGCYMQ